MFRAESPTKIAQTSEYQKVPNLSDCWKKFLHELPQLSDKLGGKMFRASCFVSQKKTDNMKTDGESLIIFAALHAAIEGIDLANLLRGKLDNEKAVQQKPAANIIGTGLSSIFYTLTGMMIVASSHILSRARRRPALIPTTQHINLERRGLQKLARAYGVSQKGLLFAFARHSINQIESPTYGIGLGKRASVTYTEHARATHSQDDRAIRMRLRTDLLSVNGDVKKLAERFDAMFLRKHKKPYFFQRTNNSAIRINRILERILPSLYGQKMFDYLPFSECYTLLPPNRFRAHLGDLGDGTIMTGSMSRGLDVITFSPGQDHIHIAFKTEPARGAVTQNCLDTLIQHGLLAERVALER